MFLDYVIRTITKKRNENHHIPYVFCGAHNHLNIEIKRLTLVNKSKKLV